MQQLLNAVDIQVRERRIEYTLLGPPFLPIYVSVTSLRVCGNFQKQKKSMEK